MEECGSAEGFCHQGPPRLVGREPWLPVYLHGFFTSFAFYVESESFGITAGDLNMTSNGEPVYSGIKLVFCIKKSGSNLNKMQ